MRQLIHSALLFSLLLITSIVAWADSEKDTADRQKPQNVSASNNPVTDYIIGPGDILDVSVWKEAALTKLVTVLPDGKISFPLIGEIMAEGLTVKQLKKKLEEKILRYVPHPNLSVAVHEVNSLQIYVIGKVHNPGHFELHTNLNVLQALSMAGGLNPFAKKNKIKIFRETRDGTKIFDFRYADVIEGKHLEQNMQLVRGDVIVVP
jgi:polysaccharide export outer membrane protein